MSGNLHFSVQYRKLTFTIRGAANAGSMGLFEDDDYDVMSDIAFLIGPVFQSRKHRVSLAVGVGSADGAHYRSLGTWLAGHEKTAYDAVIGFPLEGQYIYTINDTFGIGLYSYLNFNKHKNFGGACVSLFIGQFIIE